ncbi:DUF924 family protein [Pseudidiomarina insulisalsae]|uniref:DUF924 domain-containing protein n=1 Tax=Pseudidiomarina insulisalsae TaxID=575789 RepID=A0A432YMP1_9GAMM|nr:DUF924 family protein [Pseudidiomarina insulisalsae]RUO62202.1 DUF924 domain-containing protein [Pseudidiomarina insulisalsae]
MKAQEVLEFWFGELEPADWFRKSDELDARVTERFGTVLKAAAAGECWQWRRSGFGRLAEIIVLDQFSRNVYRDTAAAFAQDAMALVLAQEAVALGVDSDFSAAEKAFLYMPYMHSESLVIHDQAMVLFNQPGLETNFDFEVKHRDILQRFGRYPHRNAILGRVSSAEEKEFLAQPGSAF